MKLYINYVTNKIIWESEAAVCVLRVLWNKFLDVEWASLDFLISSLRLIGE
jgi:hypothetical protein